MSFSRRISLNRGTLSIFGVNEYASPWLDSVPADAREQRIARDGEDFHITILSAVEMKALDERSKRSVSLFVEQRNAEAALDIHIIGLATLSDAWYAVVSCPVADALRKTLNLPAKQLHITLGFYGADSHAEKDLLKNMKSFAPSEDLMAILKNLLDSGDVSTKELELISIIGYHLLDNLGRLMAQGPSMLSRRQPFISSLKDIVRAMSTNIAAKTDPALLQLVGDVGFALLSCGLPLGLKYILGYKLQTITNHSPTGAINSAGLDLTEVEAMLPIPITSPSISNCRSVIRSVNMQLMTHMEGWDLQGKVFAWDANGNHTCMRHLPHNFSWLKLYPTADEGGESSTADSSTGHESDSVRSYLLAGCGRPMKAAHIVALAAVGIQHIITVHERAINKELVELAEKQYGIQVHHFAVVDRTPPSVEQVQQMLAIMHPALVAKTGVVVHCQGGFGRTNTVLIAYLMQVYHMSASAATDTVTAQRRIILAQSQQSFLRDWWVLCNSCGDSQGDGQSHVQHQHQHQQSLNNSESATASLPPVPNQEVTPAPKVHGVPSAPATIATTTTTTAAAAVGAALEYQKRTAGPMGMPPLLVLCGFAASGKSTFANALVHAQPGFFHRINKDEMRGKGQCENTLYDALRRITGTHKASAGAGAGAAGVGAVVIDCCNLTEEKRQEWLDLAHCPRAWCVFFDIPLDQCKYRIQHRQGHATIPAGAAGLRILDSMAKQLQPPVATNSASSSSSASSAGSRDKSKGRGNKGDNRFEKIIHLESEADVRKLLSDWSIPFTSPPAVGATSITAGGGADALNAAAGSLEAASSSSSSSSSELLLKFPRTAHAMNLGAATRDDKILPESDLSHVLNSSKSVPVIIEEKIDGANMGVFIDADTNRIMVQNRSHFVSSKYHPQFAPLEKWVHQHTADLWSILEPGRHILYGEWVYATHSVAYNHLPSWFVAYDLYDRVTEKFASRAVLAELLAATSIPHVPLVHEGQVSSVEQLLAFVKGPSEYSSNNTPREGIVVRVLDPNNLDTLQMRAKLVRSDFIAGNERWNRSNKLEVNQLANLHTT